MNDREQAMTTQMTEWYPPEVKPVRKGRYLTYHDVSGPNHAEISYWNGKRWQFYEGGIGFSNQNRRWRGLAADPEGSKP